MAISTTSNIGGLSPYADNYFEDPSDLWLNPLEEEEDDTEKRHPKEFLKSKSCLGYKSRL